MEFDKTGIILYTIQYEACVKFYRDVLCLKEMFATSMLTCFDFGGSYLMVEEDDTYYKSGTEDGRTRTCLRMNVKDVKTLANRLSSQGVSVDYQEHDWGTIAKFYDPDGNLCAFRDSLSFEAQANTGN